MSTFGAELLTPEATAAIATVLVRADCQRLETLCGGDLPAPGKLTLAELRGEGGPLLDQAVLRTVARDGDVAVVELHLHGSPAIVDALFEELARGDPPVPRRRRVDPELVPAASPRARAARRLVPHANGLAGVAILVAEAAGAWERELAAWLADGAPPTRLAGWRARAVLGRIALDRPEVALVGAPNAGKSTLLNALVGRDVVLTDASAGTTRDLVRARATLPQGFEVELIDSPGVRDPASVAERAGLELAAGRLETVDLQLHVEDGRGPACGSAVGELRVRTFADDPEFQPVPGTLSVSGLARVGLGEVFEAIAVALGVSGLPLAGGVPLDAREVRLLDELETAATRRELARCEALVAEIREGVPEKQ